MSGFLDKSAPSVSAEYGRYIDGDILGKIVAKNFLLNCIGYPEKKIYMPIGRYGDAAEKYKVPGSVEQDFGDGHIETRSGRLTFEIKCARINIANRYLGQKAENWAFTNVRTSPSKRPKKYGVLIAIGIRTLGLEDSMYWEHLAQLRGQYRKEGRRLRITAGPHEADYLALCKFFLIRRIDLKTNYFRLSLHCLDNSPYSKYSSDGDDIARCRTLWKAALK